MLSTYVYVPLYEHGGYLSPVGPGAGFVDTNTGLGTGGSHGGEGGVYDDDTFTTISDAYGSFVRPLDFGSGGASAQGETGGAGGGIIHIEARRVLNDGEMRANGAAHSGFGAGGGAGGSILVIADEIDGTLTGAFEVNGGAGTSGGGGGRMAFFYDTLNYIGEYNAYGGDFTYGTVDGVSVTGQGGAAGTVYRKDQSEDGLKTVSVYSSEDNSVRLHVHYVTMPVASYWFHYVVL